MKSGRVTFRLLLDKFHEARAVLVFEMLWIKIALQQFNQLLRHSQFFFVRSTTCRSRQLLRRQDFFSVTQSNEHQMIVFCAQCADVWLLAHYPARDAFLLMLVQGFS